jgi:hypothetical protein
VIERLLWEAARIARITRPAELASACCNLI